MKKYSYINKSEIKEIARNQWADILSKLDIKVIDNKSKHSPCPVCGGKDRFRFDNIDGYGTWFCNQCSTKAGDGISLVQNYFKCSLPEVLEKICDVLNYKPKDYKLIDKKPKKNAPKEIKNELKQQISKILDKTHEGQSEYLTNKKINYRYRLDDENRLVIPFINIHGEYATILFIWPNGDKKYLPGGIKKGSFNHIRKDFKSNQYIVVEGFATALTIELIDNDANIIMAGDLGNIGPVIENLIKINPNAEIIIAADNDIKENSLDNPGKNQSIKFLEKYGGYIALPSTNFKCDWNDYYQKFGKEKTKIDFENSKIKININLKHILNTSLPISIGSSGFNIKQYYIIKNYLLFNSIICVFGASGTYKTFLVISWACHIATGKPWANNKVNQGAVIYIVGEGGIGVKQRIKAWEIRNNNGNAINNIYLVNRPVFPAGKEDIKNIINLVKEIEKNHKQKVALIIFDTLARCFGSSDENSTQDMNSFIAGCDEIKNKTESSILLVHHTGKIENNGARGSSVLKAALDAEFYIRREKETKKKMIISCTKMKDAEECKSYAFNLDTVELFEDQDGYMKKSLSLIDVPCEVEDEIPAELKDCKNLRDNHINLFNLINKACGKNNFCTMQQVKELAKQEGIINLKNINRFLEKLSKSGAIKFDSTKITIYK